MEVSKLPYRPTHLCGIPRPPGVFTHMYQHVFIVYYVPSTVLSTGNTTLEHGRETLHVWCLQLSGKSISSPRGRKGYISDPN